MEKYRFTPFQKVLVRKDGYSAWDIDFFKRSCEHPYANKTTYFCVGGQYGDCVPYEGNEYMFNAVTRGFPPAKKKTPEEHEYKWGEVVEVKHLHMEWMKGLYVTKIHDGRHQIVLHDKYNTNEHIFEYYLDEEIRPYKEGDA